MLNGYDIAYGIGVGLSAPFWLARRSTRAKVLQAFRQRMGSHHTRQGPGPAVVIHAVSLGELNAARALVNSLAASHPTLEFVISTTTTTGWERAQQLYGKDPRITLIRFPLDFSSAVNAVLDGLRPELVILMELEVWPNFVWQCHRRNIPIVLINGRLTSGSYRNYRLGGPLIRRTFRRLAAVCAQEQVYADRFIRLGAPPEHVSVTGTMKFDTAQVAERIEGDAALAEAVGLRPGREPIWVCGSTGPGEEPLILSIYRDLLARHPGLRLVVVPRKPERFDEVADLIRSQRFPLIRRSQSDAKAPIDGGPAVVLGDTMGELRKFYSLADVVFVGRTLVDLGSRQHGSDMIEPAALAKPVAVGPFTGNFAEVMSCFRVADAMVEVNSPAALGKSIDQMLSDPDWAKTMGQRAREVVVREQGATARNLAAIERHLDLANH